LNVFQQKRRRHTTGGLTVTDITDEVNAAVRDSGVRSGIACVYSPSTTCCVRVNELEAGLLEDFAALLAKLARGHTHCTSMLLGPAGESIPVSEGELFLGRWQRVLLVELERERDGRWLVEVVGSTS
jgi:secondary thiamine-phosphate synthase enzyme